jgi:ferredoxin-NADP reductase
VDGFPVLSAGPTPRTPLEEWDFTIEGEVDGTRTWSWEEFRALPSEETTRDIHCVTKWSKLGTTWEGVSVDTLLEEVDSAAEYVVAFCDGGYTTNLPLEDVTGGKAWVAHTYEGEPLAPEHGGPARLLVPHLYFWKSAKWVRGLRLLTEDEPGSPSATTTTATRGASSATGETEMADAPRKLAWRIGEVVETSPDTPRTKSLFLEVPGWEGHRAGQHVDVRLTAEDGYQAQRSYSIASAPEDGRVELLVERLDDGEVSPYLTDELRAGDGLELRGPIGGWFAWEAREGGPLLLVAGGSGIAPLMAMIRHRQAVGNDTPVRLLFSSRSYEDVMFREELERLAAEDETLEIIHTLTRSAPPGWKGYHRRIDEEMLGEVAFSPDERPLAFVCGPTPLVEAVATDLVGLGHEPARVKTERFGPTGG